MSMILNFEVVNGPSKQQLIDSFLRCCDDAKTQVGFTVEGGHRYIGVIRGLEFENGSGYSFNYKGYFNDTFCEGWYNAYTRKGSLKYHCKPHR